MVHIASPRSGKELYIKLKSIYNKDNIDSQGMLLDIVGGKLNIILVFDSYIL